MIDKTIYAFWGKAEKNGCTYHPAICHMLDTGIVARELLAVQPESLRSQILSLFGHTKENGLAFFSALHDIGKISPGFQRKNELLCKPLKDTGFDFPKFTEDKHGIVTGCCLPKILEEELACPVEAAEVLSQVLAAHHGVFVGYKEIIDGGDKWDEARRQVVHFLANVFSIESLEGIPELTTPDLLLFAGLLTMADWLASSEEHFPYHKAGSVYIDEYMADRIERAKAMIRKLRMDSLVMAEKSFGELFSFQPNPCQEATRKVVSNLQHPMLVVVESPMGSGKTEAAQATFSMVAARYNLRGMYYALPTQATGNAMFSRMKEFLDKLDLQRDVEFHLIHANADLNPEYEELRLKAIGEQGESVVASSWFTARKRGLLASYGTGTVDQALMAVLKVRHFFLRLFGLSGKLLVLDEVHAYDAYMTEEIYRLIGWLSHSCSSVVLLSATLPQSKRRKFLESFSPDVSLPENIAYPCVIGVDVTGKTVWEEIRGLEDRTITLVPLVSSQEEKLERIVHLLDEKLFEGGCAACILNTVSEAQAVYDAVRKRIVAAETLLFHSRFTLERRLKIEEMILDRYRNGGRRPSKGIVVATQVLEQSLDVDFDFMVSDLAPVDLLLQRAGRLHRHDNHRPGLLSERTLYVAMPEFHSIPDFGRSKWVYFPDILYRTARLFSGENGNYNSINVTVPHDVGPLVEKVYGDKQHNAASNLQANLNKWSEERIGAEMAKLFMARDASLADVRSCCNDPGYLERLGNDNDDERMIGTRLARPNVTLIILGEGEALAVRGREGARKLYGRSIVTDNVHLVRCFKDRPSPVEWKDEPLLRHCHALVLRDGRTEFEGTTVSYDDEFGLRIEQKRR